MQDYWADKVTRYISMASCIMVCNDAWDAETEIEEFNHFFNELEFYNFDG